MGHLYDTIGVGYRTLRRPDPRIAASITDALGPAASVVNVGAGTTPVVQGTLSPQGRG